MKVSYNIIVSWKAYLNQNLLTTPLRPPSVNKIKNPRINNKVSLISI